jgi:hypothetical protein
MAVAGEILPAGRQESGPAFSSDCGVPEVFAMTGCGWRFILEIGI